MHLGQPARSLVPTVDAPVLLALHATTRPLTGRRLATLAGASHTAVNAILGRLTRAGIVLADRQGNAVLYRANRDHVGWVVVEALAGMRRAALEAMRAEVANWQTAPLAALCFGSFARGEGDEDSDVDLLLVRPSDVAELDDTWDRQQQALSDLVQRVTGNDCQILDIDLARLLRHVELDDPLVSNWLHDGVLLSGITLAAAIEMAATHIRASS
jgi:predicted nucleotidyltransferase